MDSQSISSTTSSIKTPRRRGVPENIKKQFADDLEANGGLHHFTGRNNQHLARLLDSNSDFYGERGERNQFHSQLRSLAQYWSSAFDTETYVSKILNPWRIVQYSARNSNERNIPIQSPTTRTRRRRTTSTRQGANISVSDSSQSSSDSSVTIDDPRVPQRTARTPRNVSVPAPPPQELSQTFQNLSIMDDSDNRSVMASKLFGRSKKETSHAIPAGASKFTAEVLVS